MLDVLAFVGLRQRDMFAHMPQGFGLRNRCRQHRVDDDFLLQRRFDQAFQHRRRMFFRFAVGQFQQHVLRMAFLKRLAQLRVVLVDQLQAKVGHQLEAGQAGAAMGLRQRQQSQRVIGVGKGRQRGQFGLRLRE